MRTTDKTTALAATIATGLPRGESFNTLSHLAGSAVCLCIAVAVGVKAAAAAGPVPLLGLAFYALAASTGFFCSALFHAAPADRKPGLRRYDRASIHLALGGLHIANITAVTPDRAALASLPVAVYVVWAIRREFTVRGERNEVLSYLVAGWGGCLLWVPWIGRLPAEVLHLEICGALAISLGAIVYRLDGLPKNHQIWHVLVVTGSVGQMAALARLV